MTRLSDISDTSIWRYNMATSKYIVPLMEMNEGVNVFQGC